MPTLFDHGLVMVFGAAVPILGVLRARALVRELGVGRPGARRRTYAEAIALQWIMAGLIAVLWVWQGRAWMTLGLGAPAGAIFWVTAGIVGLAAAAFAVQIVRVRRSPAARQQVREQVGRLAPILPASSADLRVFLALGVTAGICEEIFYRGFLMWWAIALGAPVWLAVLISAGLFGFGHAYQGADSALRIFSLGVVFGVIASLTQTIWLPIAAHALIDVASGITAYLALRGQTPGGEPAIAATTPAEPAR